MIKSQRKMPAIRILDRYKLYNGDEDEKKTLVSL